MSSDGPNVLRFSDLKDAGIVNNRATLDRWTKDHGFPPGVLLGPNSRDWTEANILDWLGSRPVEEDLEGGQ